MATRPMTDEVAVLRGRLAIARGELRESALDVEHQFNLPRRFRAELDAHPLKWLSISAAAGIVAAKVVPFLFRLTGRSFTATVVAPLLRTAAVTALPLLADTFSRKFFGQDRFVTPMQPVHRGEVIDVQVAPSVVQ